MSPRPSSIGWGFWGRWLVATTVGWVVGLIAAIALSEFVVNLVYPKETNLILGLCMGAAVGFLQMVAVRRWITLTRAWVWGAVVIGGPAFVAAVLLDELGVRVSVIPEDWLLGLIAVAGGVIGGLIQARALRPHTSRANRWVLVSIVSWGLAWLSMELAGFMAGGIVLGAAGGGLLIWLLRAPEAAEAA